MLIYFQQLNFSSLFCLEHKYGQGQPRALFSISLGIVHDSMQTLCANQTAANTIVQYDMAVQLQ